jgi:hypothetical protein
VAEVLDHDPLPIDRDADELSDAVVRHPASFGQQAKTDLAAGPLSVGALGDDDAQPVELGILRPVVDD